MDDSIQKLIKDLDVEIRKSENEVMRGEQLLRLQEIAAVYEGEDKVVSSEEIVELLKNRPEQKKMLSGFKGLDKILEGFRHKQLVVLSGVTKHGKTSFAISLTEILKDEHPLWLPFEESAEELIYKFLERGQTPPLFFTPLTMLDYRLEWIEKKIVESKAKYGSNVVFIDHLGFIVPSAENLAQETGRVVRELKNIAKRWDVVIVLLCHLTKTEVDKHPNLKDLRDSMAIGQEADTVLFIWRQTKKNRKTGEIEILNNVNLSVQANRRTGRTGNVKMVYRDGKYLEESWVEDKELEDF